MRWVKQGLIFSPSGRHERMQTHAALPFALHVGGDIYRVYFASRDADNRSHVWFAELDVRPPARIVRTSEQPVLAPGRLGHFDAHGVFPASLVRDGELVYLYYIGWNPGHRPPLFYASVGLAVSEDRGVTFRKASAVPVMSRGEFDPCLVTSPFVLREGEGWRMWYVSGFRWEEEGGELHSYYDVKYASSRDGINWERAGLTCIRLRPGERNVARPCVLKHGGKYKMWYSYNRGQGYRIGCAESPDGYEWARLDEEAGIDVSPSGWDSEALAYPNVFVHGGTGYMLYNGNGFGREGFGLAVQAD